MFLVERKKRWPVTEDFIDFYCTVWIFTFLFCFLNAGVGVPTKVLISCALLVPISLHHFLVKFSVVPFHIGITTPITTPVSTWKELELGKVETN